MIDSGEGWELRLGAWQDVLQGVVGDALVVDAPYSSRTHRGHDASSDNVVDINAVGRRSINYDYLSEEQATAWGEQFANMTTGWAVSLTDHVLVEAWRRGFEAANRYAFAPVPGIERGGRFRKTGDGPACVTVQVVPARPRSRPDGAFPHWVKHLGRAPNAYYICDREGGKVIGGKPLVMMRAIIRDYSKPGDLIVDPCAGGGTTLQAALLEGRRAIGAELDPDTYKLAVKRLRGGYTPMFPGMEL